MSWSLGAAGTASSSSPPPDRSPSPPPPYQPWESPSPSASGPGPVLLEPQPRTRSQYALHAGDPRTSSTQSLVPSMHVDEARRVLLIVYIHGFMGDNTSFRSFPAHVHSYLKEALTYSHVIHSKVYPRYKTYKAIEVARDNFSKWLEPHESARTDTILVGHSMGGLLAADVALMPSSDPLHGRPLKHRILGTISMDAPLLGLHPGIVKSGIASLFRKAPDPPGKGQELAESLASQNVSGSLSMDDGMSFSTDGAVSSGMTSPMPLASISSNASGPSQPDPTFNPPFFNDVQFVDRGWWRNVAHFAKKHYSEGILTSTYQHLLSHLEFGACLADYPALKTRYNKIRRLEDVNELYSGAPSGQGEVRVRYVNYYTVSTGIPKEPPQPSVPKRSDTHLRPEPPEAVQSFTANSSQASTPRISVEDYSDGERRHSMQILEPVPEPDTEPEDAVEPPPSKNVNDSKEKTQGSSATTQKAERGEDSGEHGTANAAAGPGAEQANEAEEAPDDPNNDLPAIPPAPEPPQAPDLERYTDKDARKQAEKEFRRVQKTYDQAVKNREKALRERQKLVEKRRKKAQKEAEKRQKEEEKRLAKERKAQQAAAAKQGGSNSSKKNKGQPEDEKEDDDEEDDAAEDQSSASRAQVVTPAQAQALERQLTDLAFHDETPSPPMSPELTLSPTPSLPLTATDSIPRGKAPAPAPAAGGKGAAKLRKFCMLPPKADGRRDPAWVQVYMEGVDEVGAHCGLFFPGPHYEKLVGDVGARIVGWVQEDMSKNAILAMG